jgi:hypothetical protein
VSADRAVLSSKSPDGAAPHFRPPSSDAPSLDRAKGIMYEANSFINNSLADQIGQ